MQLRPATPDDMATVADIWHSGWHVTHPGHVPDGLTERRTLAAFHDRAPGRVDDTTVAERDDTVVGFLMVSGDEVEQVYVDPAAFGTGVADLLLDEGERQVAAAGHDVAWLAVARGNSRARRVYERAGWTDEGYLDYPVVALGEEFISPCRRYTKRVR
jgi:ribosomal protein S18 acetylase RimI-like enzyme